MRGTRGYIVVDGGGRVIWGKVVRASVGRKGRWAYETMPRTTQSCTPPTLTRPLVIPPLQIWHALTHRSPRTLANDVSMSARITSAKNGA